MGSWRVALSEQAEADLERVTAFLARKSPEAAERIGLEIVAVIFSLEELPARGAPVHNRPGLRKVVHRRYLIIYRLHETTRLVEIVRVWDGRLNPAGLALPKSSLLFSREHTLRCGQQVVLQGPPRSLLSPMLTNRSSAARPARVVSFGRGRSR